MNKLIPKYQIGNEIKPYVYLKSNDNGRVWKNEYHTWDEAVEAANFSRNEGWNTPLNIAPEVVVTGYKPIELQTYYPLISEYPLTGHSSVSIPITDNVAKEYNLDDNSELFVNKLSDAENYNLVTNNCADATLGYLNYIFGTKESPMLFTTPGDVRDYAITQLGGKVVKRDGVDTVIIPRNKENADELSRKALNFRKSSKDSTLTSRFRSKFTRDNYQIFPTKTFKIPRSNIEYKHIHYSPRQPHIIQPLVRAFNDSSRGFAYFLNDANNYIKSMF